MKISRLAGVAALLAAGFAQAQTPSVKFDGALIEFWYTQMMDNSLRLNANAPVGGTASYYGLDSRFKENTAAIKRTEIYLSGKITEDVSWNLMFDPNNSNTATAPNNVLQDVAITWAFAPGFNVKAGQFKMPTAYEATMVGSREILFFDRNQINRKFADARDRGIWASYTYGDAKTFQGKLNLAISNGTMDDGSGGKNNDSNAQKDWTFRFESAFLADHKAGFYYREGGTNLKDASSNGLTTYHSAAIPASWTVGAPTAPQIRDNKDKTTLMGAYYAWDTATWHADFEYATGLLGRRFPTVFAVAGSAPQREHLDQKFTGFALTGVYKMGAHWLLARYDMLNYNSGDQWYTATNPYKPTTGANAGSDFSPNYTEITVGYNYLFVPTKQSMGKLKLDYILRSKNFLAPIGNPVGTQTGEQGGNSLVASLMVAF